MASVVGRRPMIAHIRQVGLLAMLAFTFGRSLLVRFWKYERSKIGDFHGVARLFQH